MKTVRWVIVLIFASTILAVVAYRFMPVYFTPLMFIRCFQQIGNGEHVRLHHHWVPLESISPSMPVAVMASEDQNFLHHHGFDYRAIENAAAAHLEKGKKLRAEAPSVSKRPRTFFCGRDARGCAKGWRLTSPSSSRPCGASSASWRFISIP